MGKQNVTVEFFYAGAWHDVVADDKVFRTPPITIDQGGGEEGAAPKPNRITLSLNNDDDLFRTSNPQSPLYGLAGRNVPCRVSVDGTVRGIGESSFEADQTGDFRAYPKRGKAWVDVDAAGLLQRIGQWSEPLKSAFRTFNDGIGSVCGYWPMEDDRGATVARSAIDGTFNAFIVGQSFGSQNAPPGGGPGIDTSAVSAALFQFLPGNAGATQGWQSSIAVYFGDLSGADHSPIRVRTANGYTFIFTVRQDQNQVEIQVIDASFANVVNTFFSAGGYSFAGRWILFVMTCSQSGGTVTVGGSWRAIGDATFLGVSTTFSGVTSDLDTANPVGFPDGSTYGHVIGTRGLADDLGSDARFTAFSGYPGELAATRFGRLCDLKGIPYYVSDNWAQSAPMGPQRVDTFAKILQEIAATDDAIIHDFGTELRLYMLCNADRTNQTPKLTLNALDDTHLDAPPKEVLNDLDPHNIVTASQREGGDYTLEDSTSAMGSQDPPAGVGEYRQTVDVNVADEVSTLPQVAGWWLAKGTLDRPRFPSVVVNLTAAPDLIPAVESIEVGNVIEIINFREYTIRLHVLGWRETIGTHSRRVAFTCALDNVYQTGLLEDGQFRIGCRSSFLAFGIDKVTTTLTLLSNDQDEQWLPGVSGAHIMLAGEEIILGTIGARSGTDPGPYLWTVTGCTRSVNGISKKQDAGPITVKDTLRMGL